MINQNRNGSSPSPSHDAVRVQEFVERPHSSTLPPYTLPPSPFQSSPRLSKGLHRLSAPRHHTRFSFNSCNHRITLHSFCRSFCLKANSSSSLILALLPRNSRLKQTMRAVASFLVVSPLLALLAVATPSPFIDLQPRTYSKSKGCSSNEFLWDNECCPKGGPSKKPKPPSGLDCPGCTLPHCIHTSSPADYVPH